MAIPASVMPRSPLVIASEIAEWVTFMSHVPTNAGRTAPKTGGNVTIDTLTPSQPHDTPYRVIDEVRWRLGSLSDSLIVLWGVLIVYALSAILIPTLAPVSISDDWTYARSVEYLVGEGRFKILSVAAATQVFQLFWGSAFAYIFGLSFGVMRLSTVVLVCLSGLAIYGICRELSLSRARSASGVAIYLFNPVLYPITFSFMSDPHFLGLLVISSYFYVRGLRPGPAGQQALIAGSGVAALACLQRPHGALIPLGVVCFFLVTRQLRVDRASLGRVLRVAAVPAVTVFVFYLGVSRGLPSQQNLFLSEVTSAGPDETWLLFRRLTVMEMTYVGLFVFPLAVAALSCLWGLLDFRRRGTWLAVLAWQGVLVAGIVWFWVEDRRMPYIPHFLGQGGPGSGDLRNARPPLADPVVFDWVTIACGASAFLFALALFKASEQREQQGRSGAGMLIAIAAWQIAGVLPQSFLFRNWIISLDRYLLPLLPFAVVLMLWALQAWRIRQDVLWFVTAAFALFSIAGTRDVLVFQSDVWALAGELNNRGVPNTRLDAGYAWDAYHLWEFGEQYDIPRQTPDGTWWTDVYARPTDSTYVIAGGPIPGYTVLSAHPYSAWLQRSPVALYVLRRENAQPDGVVWP